MRRVVFTFYGSLERNVLQIGETAVRSRMLGIEKPFSALHSVQHVILEYKSGWEILMVLLSGNVWESVRVLLMIA